MARIAIFCDGTWNSPKQAQPTHVHRLYKATRATPNQRVIYVAGVGTGGTLKGKVDRGIDRIGGGVFGWGLNANIKQAYRALAMAYTPGDEIFIFGFSRGAYTARSLAGMIRKVGIIEDTSPAGVDRAFTLYRKPGARNAPDEAHILKERREMSPNVATSDADMKHRMDQPKGEAQEGEVALVQVTYLGIWDTVGALGIPTSILGPIALVWNRKYQFHDTKLSRMVRSARHALALDERRVFYRPALWDNLEQNPEGPGLNKGDRSPRRPYQQVWFTGTHAIVGGSGSTRGLTAASLDWVAQGAQELGLQLDATTPLLDHDPDPLVDSVELMDAPLVYRLAGALLDWRKGPGHPVDLHPSARARVEGRAEYRPLSLRGLMPELFGGQPLGTKVSQKP